MFRKKQKISAAERLFDALAQSIKTEPEQWYVYTANRSSTRKRLHYKKSPEMVFSFDTNDGEVTPISPEEVRPSNDREMLAYERLKSIAKKQFIIELNENAALAMFNLFQGKQYVIMPLPKNMTESLHTTLINRTGEAIITRRNVYFTSKQDAAFFKLCCEHVDKEK